VIKLSTLINPEISTVLDDFADEQEADSLRQILVFLEAQL
jgi:hypothetical protein